jgi:hypothetical protein
VYIVRHLKVTTPSAGTNAETPKVTDWVRTCIAHKRQPAASTAPLSPVDWDALEPFTTMGIDEIALLKGHRDFVPVISAKTDLRPLQC